MSSLASHYPAPPDFGYGTGSKVYDYDLRLEVGIEDGVEQVAIHDVFVEFLRRMDEAADFPIEIRNVKDKVIELNKMPEDDDFKDQFSVEFVEAKKRKVLIGFKMTTHTPMSVMKHRTFNFLRDNHLFLRIHTGGFQNGMNSFFLGYLSEENPNTADIMKWKATILSEMNSVWKSEKLTPEDIRKQISEKFPNQVTKNKVNFPINIEKGKVMAVNKEAKKVETIGLIVTTPMNFATPVRRLLAGAQLGNKTLPRFIPTALRREDPAIYFKLMVNHAKFLHQHRNIQLLGIFPATFDSEIRPILVKNKKILRIYLDGSRDRANISTTADEYLHVCEWIDQQLKDLKLPYCPVRATRNNGMYAQDQTVKTTYSQLFKDDQSSLSDSSSFDPSTIKTTRSNAWTRRLPVKITYSTQGEDFPPMPKATTTEREEKANVTVVTEMTDTINELIADAVRKVELDNKRRIEEITTALNERMEKLEQSLGTLVNQVIEATYQSLTKSGTFVTKEDNLKLQSEVSIMNRKLDAMMDALMKSTGTNVNSPPRKTPRTDESANINASAQPICDVAMGERED